MLCLLHATVARCQSRRATVCQSWLILLNQSLAGPSALRWSLAYLSGCAEFRSGPSQLKSFWWSPRAFMVVLIAGSKMLFAKLHQSSAPGISLPRMHGALTVT